MSVRSTPAIRIKSTIIGLAVRGILPARMATWLLKVLRLTHA